MANAVTFWKGTLAAYQLKTHEEGRLYFITDAGNESLYLKDTLISPKRLATLTADTTDAVSTATAKAIVDFVKAQVAGAFADGSAYAVAIKGLQDQIDAIDGRLTTAEGDIDTLEGRADAVDTILAGYGTGEGNIATVKEDIEAVKAIASAALDFKGTVEKEENLPETAENGDVYFVTEDQSEYVYAGGKWEKLGPVVDYSVFALKTDVKGTTDGLDARIAANEAILAGFGTEEGEVATVTAAIATAKGEAIDSAAETAGGLVDGLEAEVRAFTVNNKAFGESGAVVVDGTEILVKSGETTTVAAKLEALDDAIKSITGEGEEGDATTIAGLAVQVSEIKNYTINGKKISENPVLVAADIADVYSKTEVDTELGKKVDLTTYNGKVESIEGRLDATEGVANGAAAAVATKVEQEAYNTKMGELDSAIGAKVAQSDYDEDMADIAKAIEDVNTALTWIEG